MALKVWLPLNNDLKNVGLDENTSIQKIGSGVVLDNNGVFSKCYKFPNTSSNYIQTTSKCSDLFTDNSSYSVCFWVKLSAYPTTTPGGIFGCNKYISEQTTGGYKGGGFGVLLYSGEIRILHATSGTNISYACGTIPLTAWTHVAITYESNSKRIISYVNGQSVLSQVCSLSWTVNGSPIVIGINSQGGCNYTSEKFINDFRIYDHCITPEDVKRIYNCKTFDLVSQCNVTFNRAGQIAGGVIPYNVTTSGSAFYLNGSNAAIQIPFTKMQSGEFTMNTWFYKDSFGPDRWETIFGGPSGFELEMKNASASTPVIVTYSWGTKQIPYSLNQWNMLTMTRNSSKTMFYLNGVYAQSGSAGSIPATSSTAGQYFIGAWKTYGGQNFKGYVKEFSIYSKELQASEISKLYAIGPQTQTDLNENYIKLAFIEGTGTQQINTEIKFNLETDSFKIVFKGNNTSHNGMIFASSNKPYFWLYYYSTNGIRVYADNGNGQQGIGEITSDLNKHTAEISNKHYYIDSVDKGSFSNTYTNTYTNMYMFSYGNGYFFKGRIYYLDVKKNNIFSNMFIPVIKKSDGTIGMYDKIQNKFLGNAGSGSFIAGPIYAPLPNEYVQVEYIKMTPGKYINTGVAIVSGDTVNTKAFMYYDTGTTRDLMGWSPSGAEYWGCTTASTWEKVSALNSDITSFNNLTYNYTSRFNGTYQIGALTGSYSTRTKYVSYFKITVNNEVKREMFACYRKSDKIAGMYDIITNTFYTNAVSGTFTAGPEI